MLAVPTAEQKKALEIQHGLIVEEVRNGSQRSDVRNGDIILAAIVKGVQTDLKSVQQFNDLLKGLEKNAAVTLLVKRGDTQTFVTIKGASDK